MSRKPDTKYSVRKTGEPYTQDFRVYITAGDEIISPWHEIPLYPSEGEPHVVNLIVEIPRWSNVKMEMVKDEFLTPIRQDVRPGMTSYIPDIFPHKGYPWSYGALPQTWEDPNMLDEHTGHRGDSGPLDVCELAASVGQVGDINRVKVLGAFAVINEDQADWKIVAVNGDTPLAEQLDDIGDVETFMRGYLETMQEWFRLFKVPEGGEENELALKKEFKGRDFALSLIARSHGSWKKMKAEQAIKTKASMAEFDTEGTNLAKKPS